MLMIDPAKRLKIPEAINDAFFNSCRDSTIERTSTETVDLSDVEALALIREDIQSMMTMELVSVRYGNIAGQSHHHRRSQSGVGTNTHGSAAVSSKASANRLPCP